MWDVTGSFAGEQIYVMSDAFPLKLCIGVSVPIISYSALGLAFPLYLTLLEHITCLICLNICAYGAHIEVSPEVIKISDITPNS